MQPSTFVGALDDARLAESYAYPDAPRWVRANMVATVDGAAAAKAGVSAGISGESDRRLLALLRALADVIVVGPGTVRAERYGPARLRPEHRELRAAGGRSGVPAIAVISANLDLDFSWPLFTQATAATILLTSPGAPAGRLAAARAVADVVEISPTPHSDGPGDFGIDLAGALAALVERGHTRMLCEGGPGLLASLTAAGLLDEVCLTVSPLLVGGSAGRIMRGAATEGEGVGLRAGHALIDPDGFLFLRYLVERS
ncbi:MAG: dihydrofolate reductase family protein [Sporichthyaceae bacterium]